MRTLAPAALAAALTAALALSPAWAQDDSSDSSNPVPTISVEEGLQAWSGIEEVLSHPRCANCHVIDDHPRWSGAHYGATGSHAMNVQRGPDGFGNTGMRCMTCHQESNSPELHGPPGAPHWHLAPAEMVWFGKTGTEICEQIKDPERNGDRTLAEIAEHIADDPLVRWGWEPGPGREPAPGTPEATADLVRLWESAGAPCPPR